MSPRPVVKYAHFHCASRDLSIISRSGGDIWEIQGSTSVGKYQCSRDTHSLLTHLGTSIRATSRPLTWGDGRKVLSFNHTPQQAHNYFELSECALRSSGPGGVAETQQLKFVVSEKGLKTGETQTLDTAIAAAHQVPVAQLARLITPRSGAGAGWTASAGRVASLESQTPRSLPPLTRLRRIFHPPPPP